MDRECEKKVNKKEEKILQKAVVLCISSQVHLRAFLCRFFTMMLTNLAQNDLEEELEANALIK